MDKLAEMHLALREYGWEPSWDGVELCKWTHRAYPDAIYTGKGAHDPDPTAESEEPGWNLWSKTEKRVWSGKTVEELRARLKLLAKG